MILLLARTVKQKTRSKTLENLHRGLLTNASIGADLDTAANNELITQFINQVIPASERGAYIDGEGQISQRGFIRLRNALFQRAYNDANMTSKLSEQTDDVVKKCCQSHDQYCGAHCQSQ